MNELKLLHPSWYSRGFREHPFVCWWKKLKEANSSKLSVFEIVQEDILLLLKTEFEKKYLYRETLLGDHIIDPLLQLHTFFETRNSNPQPVCSIPVTLSTRTAILNLLPYVLGSQKVVIFSPQLAHSPFLDSTFGLNGCVHYFQAANLVSKEKVKLCRIHKLKILYQPPVKELRERLVLVDTKRVAANTSKFNTVPKLLKNLHSVFETFSTVIVESSNLFTDATLCNIMNAFPFKQVIFLNVESFPNVKRSKKRKIE